MGDDEIESVAAAQIFPMLQVPGIEWSGAPLSLVFHENLEGVHLQTSGFPRRVGDAAGD